MPRVSSVEPPPWQKCFHSNVPCELGGGVCACCAKLAELNAAIMTAPTATAARRDEPVALSFMASPKLRSRS